MSMIPFYLPNDEDGYFYCLAFCEGQYNPGRATIPAIAGFFFSPSEAYTRFSYSIFSAEFGAEFGAKRSVFYQSGSTYCASVEAALLDAWEGLSIPAFAWTLFPLAEATVYAHHAHDKHQASYLGARKEFCRALYPLRMRAYAKKNLGALPFFAAPERGFQAGDAFVNSAENQELLSASMDDEAP